MKIKKLLEQAGKFLNYSQKKQDKKEEDKKQLIDNFEDKIQKTKKKINKAKNEKERKELVKKLEVLRKLQSKLK